MVIDTVLLFSVCNAGGELAVLSLDLGAQVRNHPICHCASLDSVV